MPDWLGNMNTNYEAATKDMGLSAQEQFLYQHHIDNLKGSGKVIQPDGDVATLKQAIIERNGQFYNIPTVWSGKILPVPEAQKKAEAVGLGNFPSYNSIEEADSRYMQMHEYMDRDVGDYLERHK